MNGNNSYRPIHATQAFLLSIAARRILGSGNLIIEHSFANGLFCRMDDYRAITLEEIQALKQLMQDWLNSEENFIFDTITQSDMLNFWRLAGLNNKPAMLEKWKADPVPAIRFGDYWDYRIEPMSDDKNLISNFELTPYKHGFILRYTNSVGKIPAFIDQPKLFSEFKEHEQWGDILGVDSVRNLNELISTGNIHEMIWVAEGLHEKKMAQIADNLKAGFPEKRLIFISGPSSSGKTTFAKRLRIQMRINGFNAKQISIDDYFIDRTNVKIDENGETDFEALEVVNLDLLCERLDRILAGDVIPKRKFDFKKGIGFDNSESLKMDEQDFLIVEGIHGLNPVFPERLGAERVQRIYVSALTQLNIDGDHRVSTSDNRLLRRIVRDHKFRHYTPEQTLERWLSVRSGEEKNIFPYQEDADYMFNTALVYELPVLAKYAKPLLESVSENSPVKMRAERLSVFLSFFEQLEETAVPETSILREFIGGSGFHY